MLQHDWATIEGFLEEIRLNDEKYAVAWRTAWYIWNVHKQGIMCIVSSNMVTLVPFSNEQFNNRFAWPINSSRLTFTLDGHSYARSSEYYYAKQSKHGISEGPYGVIRDQSAWWLNGHLLCNTAGPWSTRGLEAMQKTLQDSLLPWPYEKAIFFINRRDFPLMTHKSKVTPHWPVFGPKPELPMFYGISQWSPILSYYGSGAEVKTSDALWPVPEHWNLYNQTFASWPKKPMAVFRGTLTGRYTDERNVRLALVNLKHPNVDAKLTAWTSRCRIYGTSVEFNGKPQGLQLGQPMTMHEQSTFAILLYVPGHVASMRLGWHFMSGSCVIKIEDESCVAPMQWFDHLFTEGHSFQKNKHYLSTTLSNLPQLLMALQTEEGLAYLQKIGQEAQAVARRVFHPEFMMSYTRTMLCRLL
jgi:hypothetical protein